MNPACDTDAEETLETCIQRTYESILKDMDETNVHPDYELERTGTDAPPPTPEPFPDMSLLRSELRRLTNESYPEKEAERDRCMFASMDRLYRTIVDENVIGSMYEAAQNGYDQAIVYRFPHQGTWEDYPILFLLKGPMVDRGSGTYETFFHQKGGESLMERLKRVFQPFHVKHRFNRLRQENLIIVSWMVPSAHKPGRTDTHV